MLYRSDVSTVAIAHRLRVTHSAETLLARDTKLGHINIVSLHVLEAELNKKLCSGRSTLHTSIQFQGPYIVTKCKLWQVGYKS